MKTHIEDYNVITLKNEIKDYIKWSDNIGLNNNISENPYPVMYIGVTPIYEGDKVIYKTEDGNLLIRTIYWQNRVQARNEKWRNQCFLNIKDATYNYKIDPEDPEVKRLFELTKKAQEKNIELKKIDPNTGKQIIDI